MDVSNLIAIAAVIVSVVSAWYSYRANRNSLSMREAEEERKHSREISEFLVEIEEAQDQFESLEHRIKAFFERLANYPESPQASLKKETKRMQQDLDHLEKCQRQARLLWGETAEIGNSGLAHHKPRYVKLIKEDKEFAAEALKRIELLENMLRVDLNSPQTTISRKQVT